MKTKNRRFSLTNYPLSWPEGWARVDPEFRKRGNFKTYGNSISIMGGINRILAQLASMKISRDDVLISTNVQTRLDGLPRSDQREPSDPGVAVYWRKNQNAQMQCMAIDIYRSVADNLAAVAATLDAMRAIERHGGAQVQERTFRGFAALPAKTGRAWWEVLRVRHDATEEVIESSFRALAFDLHPDRGGSHHAMSELNKAREEALAEIEGAA
jgi:hypothetical protein